MSPEPIEAAIQHIADLNPVLHAVISLDPAAKVGPGGPLAGVPLLIKDNIRTAGFATTAGSTAMSGYTATTDAPAVAALRSAGATIVGTANLSEWANFRSTRSTSGWSALGGLTVNPYALDRSAGGSSSGSAAAVGAGMVPAALGTETDGSILVPAAFCGCVGLKPTVGLVSTDGVVPIAPSQDSVGPITDSVTRAAIVLDALTGVGATYSSSLNEAVGGLTVGVARRILWGRRSDLDDACEAAVDALAAGGAVVREVEVAVPFEYEDETTLLLYEFKHAIGSYLAAAEPPGPSNLAELIAWNDAHPEELEHFGQELFISAAEKGSLDDAAYVQARARLQSARHVIDSAGVDAIIVPTCPPAWKSDLVNGDPQEFDASSTLPAVAGYPAITIPAGLVRGLPVGVTLFGSARSEALLLRLAKLIEDSLGPLPPPGFRPPGNG